jgi:hypothetical protein
MKYSNRSDAARAVAAVLLAVGLPTLTQAAPERSGDRAEAPVSRTREQATAPRLTPMLDFLAKSIGTDTEALASPHLPPGQPPGRPPGSPPGQTDPPNPPGKPPDRPPDHSNGGGNGLKR